MGHVKILHCKIMLELEKTAPMEIGKVTSTECNAMENQQRETLESKKGSLND